MSATQVKSSHGYGIGILVLIVAMGVTISWYTMYWLPEENQKVFVDEHILNPDGQTIVNIIEGSSNPDQKDNYTPKIIRVQLTIDNKVTWKNIDTTPHTVTPDSHDRDEITDPFSGEFGSIGVIMPGEDYEFLFTDAPPNGAKVIPYHCDPHPWMTGTVEITKSRF
ncbi:MAG: plastocyanin/azurin family copper-binding protein [Crenarchaeota archaeon]|nr:plastocyanin/azurin family copper-binding protein [Thermoproteota archaeon]MDA1125197.1 plastocyanin/azurin family copper-binding protein [Thermoproteota archaeon]